MNIIKCKNKEEMSLVAYDTFINYLNKVEDPVIGFATGSSPLGLYGKLIENYQNKNISFKDFKAFNLDEYVGLGKEHNQSYFHFMKENLYKHIDFDKSNIFIPNGIAEDLDKECEHYEELLSKYRIDVQILGIGSNGHIAFNEPHCNLGAGVHVTDLNSQTIEDNSRFFTSINDVPKQAITMGLKNILHAKKIILIASGKSKAEALRGMIYDNITPSLPASIIQLHRHVTVIVDDEAGKLI